MDRDPCCRLGSSPRDAEDIKDHNFFKEIDWKKVMAKQYPVPMPEPITNQAELDFSKSIFWELDQAKKNEAGIPKMRISSTNNVEGWSFIKV